LKAVHRRAVQELQSWSGPFPSEEGDYYYNLDMKASSWENPIEEWQNEIELRHDILTRGLLPADNAAGGAVLTTGGISAPGGTRDDRQELLDSLRLPLDLVRRECSHGDVPVSPSTSRTFVSATSARSKHSLQSDKVKHREHREHRERRRAEQAGAAVQEAVQAAANPEALRVLDSRLGLRALWEHLGGNISEETIARARKFIDDQGAQNIAEIREYELVEDFVECLSLKPIPRKKCMVFFESSPRELAAFCTEHGGF